MKNTAEMIKEFHDTFVPAHIDLKPMRATLLHEEHRELQEALEQGNRKEIAQELADLIYVAYGTALVFDIDLDAAIREVHRANMTKLGEDGKPILRDDGKVLKGPNYTPPDMSVSLI